MATTTTHLQLRGIGKQKLAALEAKARRLGMTSAKYVTRLIEQDLALDREAPPASLPELFGPGREVDEAELDRLVDQARTRHHRRVRKQR